MDLNILHLSSWKIATNFLDKEYVTLSFLFVLPLTIIFFSVLYS